MPTCTVPSADLPALAAALAGLLCHQAEPLGDGGQLQAHVGFVDGADIVKLTAQLLHDIAA